MINLSLQEVKEILLRNLPNFDEVKKEICKHCWFNDKCTVYCDIYHYVKKLFDEYVEKVLKDFERVEI